MYILKFVRDVFPGLFQTIVYLGIYMKELIVFWGLFHTIMIIFGVLNICIVFFGSSFLMFYLFQTIVYFGTAKNRFQMEVPDSVRHVPDEYEVTSSRKGFKRYTTPDIKELFSRLTDTEDRRDAALKDIMRRIFHTFDNR